jgi:hypothetical protein
VTKLGLKKPRGLRFSLKMSINVTKLVEMSLGSITESEQQGNGIWEALGGILI